MAFFYPLCCLGLLIVNQFESERLKRGFYALIYLVGDGVGQDGDAQFHRKGVESQLLKLVSHHHDATVADHVLDVQRIFGIGYGIGHLVLFRAKITRTICFCLHLFANKY